MRERTKGQNQIKRRRGIVDTLNGTGQNLNMMQALTPVLDPYSEGGGGGGYTPPDTGGGTGSNSGSTGSTSSPTPSSGGSCPNPGTAYLTETGSATNNGVTTQVFAVGNAVNPGFIYQCGVYSVVLSVTAVDGDTPDSIASKLAAAINNTPLSTWNQYGSNNHNYKPTATASGGMLTTKCDYQHSFFGSGTGSCSAPPPPPPPADPAFPYDQFQIDAMDCQTITANLQQVQQTMQANNYTSWQAMYDYMVQRQATACAAPPPPPPPPPPQGDPAFPYTKDQIDGMQCELLQTTIVAVQQQVAQNGYTTWDDMIKYMQDRSKAVCAVSQTETPPMTPVPGISTPQVIPFPIYGSGGGGSGSGSKQVQQPVPAQGKTYLWLAIGVGSALAYFTFGGGSIVKV